ncbi:MAG: pantoate--beta-alanine ligase [Actinomycetia bacterium]|nr:pantoate--beta-alanine ligase [Actinomycetes bacterium]
MVTFAVVGPGRAGGSFWLALREQGWIDGSPGGVPIGRGADLEDLAATLDVILLAVPDSSIASVAAMINPGRAAVLHLSGAKGLDVLSSHERRGSVHPLLSLPDAETGARRLTEGGVFAVAGHESALDLVATLGGRAVTVPDERRGLYHATAAVAANHLVALCAQVERLGVEVGVPIDAYWDLMSTTLDNVRRSGPLSSLTGPAARGDDSTVSLHLDVLPPTERPLYRKLATEAARLAGHPPLPSLGLMSRADRATVVASIDELRALLDDQRSRGSTIGFVPTMGYLHEGHGSLIRAAAEANDVVVASIFVNPLQFAPEEDLASYPRDLERDTELAEANGVSVLFTPSVEEMYPFGRVLTSVSVEEVSSLWEGASRSTHFRGVATVVTKLFNIVGPCRAYFGEKDFQQVAVLERMVHDLSIPVQLIGCPIVRESDGLALSSRNMYLSSDERVAARVLRRALDQGVETIVNGERETVVVDEIMASVVATEALAELDYAAAVDARTLTQSSTLDDPSTIRLLIAARVGSTRLIDNSAVTPTGQA